MPALYTTSLHWLVIIAFALISPSTYANPVAGSIAYGDINIDQSGATTTINQTSQQGIINWESFNIDANEHTHFQQPSGGVTLNRINPNQGPSEIYGKLTATGQIILTNTAGIFFGPNSYVNVGSIIASTAGISTANFLSGNYTFDQISAAAGQVINQGTIIAAQHGLVALLGNGVSNSGHIQAELGTVILGSGKSFTLAFNGNNNISFAIDSEAAKGIQHNGSIQANGGKVIIAAKTAQAVLDNVINLEGVIEAKSAYEQNGEIIISGDIENSVVRVTSKLDVSGNQTGETGGVIDILGHYILLDIGAYLEASGDAGGGTVHVGGNYLGSGPLPNAMATVMHEGARIIADAITYGMGGRVILWADNVTRAYGSISVKGGTQSGDGGFIETSGKQFLDANGVTIITSAIAGNPGTWLLDPADLTITTANSNVSGSSPFEPSASSSTLNVTTLTDALASGNVTIETNNDSFSGNGDIIITTAISYTSAFNLILSAFRHITSTLSNALINNAGTGTVTLRADNTGTGIGTIQLTGTTPNVTASGGVTIYYNPGTFGTQDTLYTGGTTPTQYMLINSLGGPSDTTTRSLASISNSTAMWGENFALAKNVDASATSSWNSSAGFSPIGNATTQYSGKFDGQDFTISNLTINRSSSDNQALFGYVTTGVSINNLSVSGSITGDDYVGGIIGRANNTTTSTFDDLNNSATIKGYSNVGGIAGRLQNFDLTNSYNTGAVDGVETVGGLIGTHGNNGNITDSYNTGKITATVDFNSSIGGLVGEGSTGTYNRVYNTGNIVVTGNDGEKIGGIVGAGTGATISSAYNTGNISLTGSNHTIVGGLVGEGNRSITNSYNTGNISGGDSNSRFGGIIGSMTGSSVSNVYNTGDITVGNNGFFYVGGIIGMAISGGGIAKAFNTGAITVGTTSSSFSAVGGLVGITRHAITDSYNLGAVIAGAGTDKVGGIAGELDNIGSGSLNRTYHAALISATGANRVGGLAGLIDTGKSVSNSFWDLDKSGVTDAFGTNNGTITNTNGGCLSGSCTLQPSTKSSNQNAAVNLSQQATYTGGWDFGSTWSIIEGTSFPYLQVFYSAAPRVIAGDTTQGSNQPIKLAHEGLVAGTTRTAADQTYYFLVGDNLISGNDNRIADGDPLVIYFDDASKKAATGTIAPNSNGSIVGSNALTLTPNTIQIGGDAMSITDLINIAGSLSDTDLLFSGSGSTVTIGTSISDIDFIVADGTSFKFNGNLISAATNSTDVTFNDTVSISSTSQLTLSGSSSNTASFKGSISGSGNLTVSGSTSTDTLSVNTGSTQTWNITSNDAGNLTGMAGYTGTMSFNNIENLTGTTSANNTFYFANNTSLSGTLNAGGNINTYTNTIDWSAYTSVISADFPNNKNVGITKNASGITITSFQNVNNIVGNFDLENILTTSYKPNAIIFTGLKRGFFDDPTYFYGFGKASSFFSYLSDTVTVIEQTNEPEPIQAPSTKTPGELAIIPWGDCTALKFDNDATYNDCQRAMFVSN